MIPALDNLSIGAIFSTGEWEDQTARETLFESGTHFTLDLSVDARTDVRQAVLALSGIKETNALAEQWFGEARKRLEVGGYTLHSFRDDGASYVMKLDVVRGEPRERSLRLEIETIRGALLQSMSQEPIPETSLRLFSFRPESSVRAPFSDYAFRVDEQNLASDQTTMRIRLKFEMVGNTRSLSNRPAGKRGRPSTDDDCDTTGCALGRLELVASEITRLSRAAKAASDEVLELGFAVADDVDYLRSEATEAGRAWVERYVGKIKDQASASATASDLAQVAETEALSLLEEARKLSGGGASELLGEIMLKREAAKRAANEVTLALQEVRGLTERVRRAKEDYVSRPREG